MKHHDSQLMSDMVAAISGALAITDLWIPAIVDQEHQGEAEALHLMRSRFIGVIERHERGER